MTKCSRGDKTGTTATSRADSLKNRVVEALRDDVPEGGVRSFFSDDGRFALFSDASDADKTQLEAFVEFPSERTTTFDLPFELYVGGTPGGARRVFVGNWSTELELDGKKIAPVGAWETVCEETDDDYAFLERSVATTGKRVFSRRFFLAYNESLFLVADSISNGDKKSGDKTGGDKTGGESTRWRYRSTLNFDSEIDAKEDAEAREISLFDAAETSTRQAFARIFPLGLSEWRADSTSGDFSVEKSENGALVSTAERRGRTLFVPTLFDGNSRRAKRPCSWRPLTVGENLAAVDDDSAVGRKIQLGREQYVLYASTSERPAIRSILGRNLLSDFMFGKFFSDRGVEPIVDVETLDE